MSARGIKRRIDVASKNVNREISHHAARGGMYASAMASEGYNGGYRDALQDVLLVLNGVTPNRNNWWMEPEL